MDEVGSGPLLRDLHTQCVLSSSSACRSSSRDLPPFSRSWLHPFHIVRTSSTYSHKYSFVGQDLKIRMAALEDQVAKIQALAPSLCITRALRRAPRPRTLAP